MPRCALANDNWIGRMPHALAPDGELLGDMTLKSLARERICVNEIIAEPVKPGPHCDKQRGLRGNTIFFPQGKLELVGGCELPAPAEQAAEFMSKAVVIALAGTDKEDLRKAKWAESVELGSHPGH